MVSLRLQLCFAAALILLAGTVFTRVLHDSGKADSRYHSEFRRSSVFVEKTLQDRAMAECGKNGGKNDEPDACDEAAVSLIAKTRDVHLYEGGFWWCISQLQYDAEKCKKLINTVFQDPSSRFILPSREALR